MRTLITDIGELVTNDPEAAGTEAGGTEGGSTVGAGHLGVLGDAAFTVTDGIVDWTGPASQAPDDVDETISADGNAVIPGFVDSHNHLVFAGDRSSEFAARMAGEPYTAGGIAATVVATRQASTEELEGNLVVLMRQAEHSGTTTFEIKTGYGLSLEEELRGLDLISRHTDEATLLAAHVVPPEYRDDPEGYVDLVVETIIPAASGKAKWIDAFCETGAFTEAQSARILDAGISHGMQPRLHANQLTESGALRLAAQYGCASADHATFASDADLAALAAAGTVATLLPGVEFSTRQPYPDARRFFAAGVTVALATDCNPGSSFTNSMPFCIAVAVRDMHFTVEQAVWAATAGGAAALRRPDIGRLAPGARADFSILTAPSYRHLAYRPGVNLIGQVHRAGRPIAANPTPTRYPDSDPHRKATA